MAVRDADRERIIELLSEHYASSRLDREQLDVRVATALQARDDAELSDALAGLPATAPAEPLRSTRTRGRHGEAAVAEPGWLKTRERFRDPGTGRVMRVFVDPASGARRYVPEAGSPG